MLSGGTQRSTSNIFLNFNVCLSYIRQAAFTYLYKNVPWTISKKLDFESIIDFKQRTKK